jgi:hypothetical protein
MVKLMPGDKRFYFEQLYPLQDQALQVISSAQTGFYLTGGTAVSRAYLQHRFSDDLDLFVNYHPHFGEWSALIIDALTQSTLWQTKVILRQQYFVRILLFQQALTLKIELVNDVPAHVGAVRQHPILGQIDSPENILANKLTALVGREEPRDIADIWGLCTQLGLAIQPAIEGAQSKAAGLYPPDLARRLCTVTYKDWEQVLWIDPPPVEEYLTAVVALGEGLILVV